METIKATTKRGLNYINAFKASTATELSNVYSRPSWEKQRAYKWCREQMAKEGGRCFRVISAGCFFLIRQKIGLIYLAIHWMFTLYYGICI